MAELRNANQRQRYRDRRQQRTDPVGAAADPGEGRPVAQARRAFERVGSVSSARAEVQSTVTGRVVEVKKRVGDLVKEGEVVATVEPPGAGIEPVVYINSGNGKRIKPGMEALVLPSNVRPGEYGFMKAKIGVVGEYPVTAEAVKAMTRERSARAETAGAVDQDRGPRRARTESQCAQRLRLDDLHGSAVSDSRRHGGHGRGDRGSQAADQLRVAHLLGVGRLTVPEAAAPPAPSAAQQQAAAQPLPPPEEKKKPPIPRPPNKRVSTPTILQMEAVECGAAALGDGARPLRAAGCRSKKSASRVRRVARRQQGEQRPASAARKYGLDAKGFKYDELEKLYELELPVDPVLELQPLRRARRLQERQGLPERSGAGPARRSRWTELDGSYSGVVLTFEPGPEFKKGGARRAWSRRCAGGWSGPRCALMFAILCGLFLVVPGLVDPDVHAGLHRQLPGARPGVAGHAAALGDGRHARRAGRADLAAEALPAAPRDQAGARRRRASSSTTSSGCPPPYFGQRFAGEIGSRVLINDKVADDHLGQARRDRHRQRHDGVLRGADVSLRRRPDADRDRRSRCSTSAPCGCRPACASTPAAA